MQTDSFQKLFCVHFGVPDSEFADELLRRCLPLHARILLALVRRLNPTAFALDLEIVRHFGVVTSLQEALREANTLRYAYRNSSRTLRYGLRVRVSGRRLMALAQQLYTQPNSSS